MKLTISFTFLLFAMFAIAYGQENPPSERFLEPLMKAKHFVMNVIETGVIFVMKSEVFGPMLRGPFAHSIQEISKCIRGAERNANFDEATRQRLFRIRNALDGLDEKVRAYSPPDGSFGREDEVSTHHGDEGHRETLPNYSIRG